MHNWAIVRFVEEATDLRTKFHFNPEVIGRKQYLEQIAAAEERERPAMANAIKQYFAINPPVGRVRSWLRAGREVTIQFAAEFAKRLTKD